MLLVSGEELLFFMVILQAIDYGEFNYHALFLKVERRVYSKGVALDPVGKNYDCMFPTAVVVLFGTTSG